MSFQIKQAKDRTRAWACWNLGEKEPMMPAQVPRLWLLS